MTSSKHQKIENNNCKLLLLKNKAAACEGVSIAVPSFGSFYHLCQHLHSNQLHESDPLPTIMQQKINIKSLQKVEINLKNIPARINFNRTIAQPLQGKRFGVPQLIYI